MRFTPTRLAQAVPVAEIPQWLRSLRSANTKFYDRRLTHVTSEELCNDTLQVLKDSLPPPQTCDIIDLNPGPCLWSQKLHELVKPRRHVLVEPRRNIFADFIEPLLSKRNSPYRYAKSINNALDINEQHLSEDVYSFRAKHSQAQAQKYRFNEKLLITANLSGMAKRIAGFTGSEAKRFLNDYYRSLFVREDYIHRYGLVRLLAWIGEDARISVMPLTVNSRTKQSVQLETTYNIDQVASPSQFRNLYPHQRRWYYLDVENQKSVRMRQEEMGIRVPPDRDQPQPQLPFTALEPTVDQVRRNKDLYPYNQVYIKRLLELDENLSVNEPEWYAKYHVEVQDNFKNIIYGKKDSDNPKTKQFRTYMTQLRTHHNTYLKAKDFVWEQRQLFQKIQQGFVDGWFSSASGLPLAGVNEEKATKLFKEDQLLQVQRQGIKIDTRSLINKSGDDYRCYDSPTPTLAWNRRHYDPILVRDREFFPNNPLTLLDFKPNSTIPAKLNTVDKQICFDHVCTLLMTNAGESVMQGIKRLISAGHDQFVERIPELRDPTKGGWWDLDHVRVRALHPDTFIAITLAFHDWSHRPDISKLMAVYKGVFEHGPL